MMPPIVPGVTERGDDDASPMGMMMEMLAGGGQKPGLSLMREGMASLREAADADPRIADRIRRALEALTGNDGEGDDGGGGSDKVSPSMGDVKSPI